MQYIQEAKKLGLDDDAIRRHATSGGWEPKLIEEALTVVSRGPVQHVETRRTPGLPEGYRLGAGDVIQVSVWKEPDASVEGIVVRADGKVSLPLVKEVEIAGLNPLDAEKMLTERFGKFIPGADVTLIVREVHSRKVYLVGAVRTVGAVDMVSRLTVLQAITQAGGVTDYAKKKQIYVLRNEGGKQVRFPFNYEAVIKGEQIEQNILLQPDDTIVVP
jgi:polysaccharide export outer membrane protein